jgi:ribonuclease D
MAQLTITRSRQRKPAIASKRDSMQPTSDRTTLEDLDSFAETEDEKRAWKKLLRNLVEQAKNFDLEASIKKLKHLALVFDGAKNTKKRIKYQLLGEVYKQYMMALAGGNLSALMNLYRDDGMIIHSDVHSILAIIRANITTERDVPIHLPLVTLQAGWRGGVDLCGPGPVGR